MDEAKVNNDVKVGKSCKLPLKEWYYDLACSKYMDKLYVSQLKRSIETFPSWHIVKKYMPEAFKKEYPNIRIIIDATEFSIKQLSSLLSQACTSLSYKNKNTVKVLIGVMPSGAVSFVSEAYEGSISDWKLEEVSGLLEN